MDGKSLKEQVQATINDTPVLIYSKTWCPYCTEAKEIFQSANIEVTSVELDIVAGGDKI
jgi:glutaredoxin 3